MKLQSLTLAVAAAIASSVTMSGCGTSNASEGTTAVPGITTKLNHVWVVMMENHSYAQVVGNPNAPYINQLLTTANQGTNYSVSQANNYFGVGHPSLTNYLEVVGGSNFGNQSDKNPDWHNTTCTPSIAASGVPVNETSGGARICPISGSGTDVATPAIDYTNEIAGTSGVPATGLWNIDGTLSYAAAPTTGKTIADQLTAAGLTWKSYQENLPQVGPDNVDNSDGIFVNTNDLTTLTWTAAASGVLPASGTSYVTALYAAKHNPFVYFKNVQEGGLGNVAGFDGISGLYADLSTGKVPAYSFVAPNQCNDMHGKSGENVYCGYDKSNDGTQNGLNSGLIYRGDQSLKKIITAIQGSTVWSTGNNAIVVVWDEIDYSKGNTNHALTFVVTNNKSKTPVSSNIHYDHFSLLKSIESGFGLPCLNHACDTNVSVMTDLFN